MVGRGFIPDPLRALCGALKGLYPPHKPTQKELKNQVRDEVALKPRGPDSHKLFG
jgi:hypothetical protein